MFVRASGKARLPFTAHSGAGRSDTAQAGGQCVTSLLQALADADVTHWPPAWAVSDRPAGLWAVSGDLAFPLARTNTPGRWLAVTCLRA